MRNKLVPILSALVVGCLGMSAWAQLPPQPDPTPLGPPGEAPPPIVTAPPATGGGIITIPGTVNGGTAVIGHGNVIGAGIFNPALGTADPCCGKDGYWTGSAGIYWLQPFFSTNPAFFTSKVLPSGAVRNRQQDFGQRLDVAPQASLGYTWGSGFGFRGRWWQYETDGQARGSLGLDGAIGSVSPATGSGTSIFVPPGSTMNATSSLHLHVYDLEFTYTHGNENWSLLYSAGVRYATMNQSYQLDVNSGGTLNTFNAYHNFGGAGPTLAIEGRHQLGDSCFALYGSARGSILFGAASQYSSVNTPSIFDPTSGYNTSTVVLPIGEIELGGEWSFTCGPNNRLRFFVQAGVVGQVWWGGGNASQGLGLSTGPSPSSTNNFGLLGGVARAGINF